MGESNLKLIKISGMSIYDIIDDLDMNCYLGRTKRINIELDLITMTGNIIIVPKDETQKMEP